MLISEQGKVNHGEWSLTITRAILLHVSYQSYLLINWEIFRNWFAYFNDCCLVWKFSLISTLGYLAFKLERIMTKVHGIQN
jgi:hypothetical protein